MLNLWRLNKDNPAEDIGKWRLPLALLFIAGLTVAVYWQVLHNEFISYDDTDYVTVNMAVRQGLTLKGFIWAFSAFHAANWHPLTWLSHMLDVEMFDLNPMGHHAVNLLLHVANSVLLCLVLHRLTGFLGRSLVVALLFAVHPLHVESVAWIAERKDVLSTLFWLLTMWTYVEYARNPSLKRYLPVAILFALGLMAKQMLVTLPIVLLLMDYWPLNRLSPRQGDGVAHKSDLKLILAEKVPLLVLSGAASAVTLLAQRSGGALNRVAGESVLLNTGNAFISYQKYIRNMFWPADLALFYPFEPSAVTALKVTGAGALFAMITFFAVVQRKERPYLLFGWVWYLITLLPVIGFIKVGAQAMADRYTYVPLIGLFIMLVWGGAEAAGKRRKGIRAAAVAAALALSALSVLTVHQIRYWQSSFDLYAHALSAVDRNWLAHNNMGILMAQQYRYDEALSHFLESVRINPDAAEGFRNLGNMYQMTGKYSEATGAYREAVRINPYDAESRFRLGYAYLLGGNMDLAIKEYQQLTRLDASRAQSLLDSIRMRGKN